MTCVYCDNPHVCDPPPTQLDRIEALLTEQVKSVTAVTNGKADE